MTHIGEHSSMRVSVDVLRLRPVGRRRQRFPPSQRLSVRPIQQLEFGHFLGRGAGERLGDGGGRRFRAVRHGAPRRPVRRRRPFVAAAPGLQARHLVGPLEIQQVADVLGLMIGRGRLAVPDVFLVLDRGRQLLDDVPAVTAGFRARLLLLLLLLFGHIRSLLLLLFRSFLLVFGRLLLVR